MELALSIFIKTRETRVRLHILGIYFFSASGEALHTCSRSLTRHEFDAGIVNAPDPVSWILQNIRHFSILLQASNWRATCCTLLSPEPRVAPLSKRFFPHDTV